MRLVVPGVVLSIVQSVEVLRLSAPSHTEWKQSVPRAVLCCSPARRCPCPINDHVCIWDEEAVPQSQSGTGHLFYTVFMEISVYFCFLGYFLCTYCATWPASSVITLQYLFIIITKTQYYPQFILYYLNDRLFCS